MKEAVNYAREMTNEEWELYHKQASKTDGFDVGSFPGLNLCGSIVPVDLDLDCYSGTKLGKFAVEEYNKRLPEGGVKLVFVKLLKLNVQSVSGIMYYITFHAKDFGAPDDQVRTYQTKVYSGIKIPPEVKLFRLEGSSTPEITEPSEKKAKIEAEEIPEPYLSDDSIEYIWNEEAYDLQVYESDGFDVDHYPGIPPWLIKPMNLDDAGSIEIATRFGKYAVEDYNKEQAGLGVMLEFLKPLKINKQQLIKDGWMRYYITLLAKDVGASADQPHITCQTLVLEKNGRVDVISFNLKASANSSPSGFSPKCKDSHVNQFLHRLLPSFKLRASITEVTIKNGPSSCRGKTMILHGRLQRPKKAQDFREQGTKLRRKMRFQNMKIKLIVLAIIIALILIIVLSVCGGF